MDMQTALAQIAGYARAAHDKTNDEQVVELKIIAGLARRAVEDHLHGELIFIREEALRLREENAALKQQVPIV